MLQVIQFDQCENLYISKNLLVTNQFIISLSALVLKLKTICTSVQENKLTQNLKDGIGKYRFLITQANLPALKNQNPEKALAEINKQNRPGSIPNTTNS